VSYVRAYKEHQCSFIFQLKQLDYGALANQVMHLFVVSFRFVSFRFVSFRFVSFRFVSFRFVSFRFVSFRFVSFCFMFVFPPSLN
jgi:hypothetical protein